MYFVVSTPCSSKWLSKESPRCCGKNEKRVTGDGKTISPTYIKGRKVEAPAWPTMIPTTYPQLQPSQPPSSLIFKRIMSFWVELMSIIA